MATGKSIEAFDIDDVSEGCNYSDDITALKKNQSPDSLNVEFFNGRIRKRKGEMAITTPPTGQGGIDTYTKLMLHGDGTNGSTTITDSEITPKVVTAQVNAQISTAKQKFGTGSVAFGGGGIDGFTKLMLHCDGVDTSTTFTDSEITPKTVTANRGAQLTTSTSKFGTASGYFNGNGWALSVLLLHLDGINGSTTFTDDASSGAKTFTAVGTAQISTAQSKFGGASVLFGSGDAITTPDDAVFNFGTGNFTIDCWIRPTSFASGSAIASQWDAGSARAFLLSCGGGNLSFLYRNDGVNEDFTAATPLQLNVWTHVALVKSAGVFYFYINGVKDVNTLTATAAMPDVSEVFSIGGRSAGAPIDQEFVGYIDEFRIFQGAAWTSSFIPALTAYTHGDYLTTPDSADWSLGSGDFTIDFWAKLNDAGTHDIIGQDSGDFNKFVLQLVSTSTQLGVQFAVFDLVGTGSFSPVVLLSPGYVTVSFSTWNHVALVRSGNNFYAFINGALSGSTTSTATIPDFTSVLSIGVSQEVHDFNYMRGFIDELRLDKGTAVWTTTFTPPTAAYSLGDYLTVPDSADWAFGTGEFTIDFWVNFTAIGPTTFYEQFVDSSHYIVLDYRSFTSTWEFFITNGTTTANYTFPWSPAMGTWYHIALVRSGSTTISIYVNGTALTPTILTPISINPVPDFAAIVYIGVNFNGSLANYFNGYIDEYRISKGIARWRDNFTPPSVAYDTFNASDPVVGFSLVDFSNTSDHHEQVAHLGNTVYAYDQLTTTKLILRSGAPKVRSFNAKVGAYLIQTYNDYSVPYYWDGAAATMDIVSNNAPGFKRAIEFQGYMIGMNTSANPTRCYYQPIGNLLGGGAAYTDYFTLTPAPNDDETTDPFLLNGRLYVGTKYAIFRISFVGGVTVFEFKQVISDIGIVPGTAQTVITKQFGQVVLFLGTDKRIYMFDGANVKTISDLFYYSNVSTPIALDLIDDNYKENAFAIYDTTKRIYRLFITKKADSRNNYCMNIDVDTFAYYPFDNMQFAAGCMCFDSLLKPYVVCADYVGKLHKMFIDTNTDNGTAINEYFTSPIVTSKDTTMKAGDIISFSIIPVSSANLLIYDKVDFKRAWTFRQQIPLASPRDKFLGQSFVLGSALLGSDKDILLSQLAVKATFNTYQFKIVCDTPTAQAWEIFNIHVIQSMLKFGYAEAQR